MLLGIYPKELKPDVYTEACTEDVRDRTYSERCYTLQWRVHLSKASERRYTKSEPQCELWTLGKNPMTVTSAWAPVEVTTGQSKAFWWACSLAVTVNPWPGWAPLGHGDSLKQMLPLSLFTGIWAFSVKDRPGKINSQRNLRWIKCVVISLGLNAFQAQHCWVFLDPGVWSVREGRPSPKFHLSSPGTQRVNKLVSN